MKNKIPENVQQIADGFQKSGLETFFGDVVWASGEEGISLISLCFNLE
jgi:hypothetical protein